MKRQGESSVFRSARDAGSAIGGMNLDRLQEQTKEVKVYGFFGCEPGTLNIVIQFGLIASAILLSHASAQKGAVYP
jgi:hypothetical protein